MGDQSVQSEYTEFENIEEALPAIVDYISAESGSSVDPKTMEATKSF